MADFTELEILQEKLDSVELRAEALVSACLGKSHADTGACINKLFVKIAECKTLCDEIAKQQTEGVHDENA